MNVAQHRYPCLLSQIFGQHLFNVAAGDRVAVTVLCPLCHHHDTVPPTAIAASAQDRTHLFFPRIQIRRALWDQREIGPRCQRAHQRKITAMVAHYLYDKRALVAGRRACDGVKRLSDAVQGGVCSN